MGRPRTPVWFPRMRVRGRRNRVKLTVREVVTTVYAWPRRNVDGSHTLTVTTADDPRALMLRWVHRRDGFGRPA